MPSIMYLYVFSLGLGGALLVMSLVMGGEDSDADADTDVHVDADAEADAGHGQQTVHDHALGDSHGSPLGFFATVLSLRFWTFFLAFFGLTGVAVDGLELVPGTWPPLALAVAVGAGTGYVAVAVVRALAHSESGRIATASDYLGATVRVLVPVSRTEMGKVRLEVRGTTVDLLARTNDEGSFPAGARAMVVQFEGTTVVISEATTHSEELP